MKRRLQLLFTALLTITYTQAAINEVTTVTNVSENMTLTTPIDLCITNDVTNALTATIDIANEDAAVLFENIYPTMVIDSLLDKITINGETAKNGTNCRVAIFRHGTLVLPHGRTYPALTVFTEANFSGDNKTYTKGNRQASLGKFNNNIRSFKLKRGYMATFANHTDGTGYSHCYIADREDLEVNLPKEMAGRVSMLRVFVWNWVSKKGCSDSRDENMMNTAHATWYYDWGAGTKSRTNHEYVPQRHHEAGQSNGQGYKGAWESWSSINASDETCTHVLGQNEPDNTSGAGEVYTYVTTIPDDAREKHADGTLAEQAKNFLYSGKRIGTFACCNPNTGWVTEYVNYCRENNIRIDFVATHYYIGGTDPAGCISRLKSLYDATGLPVWATEWNNGANWTTESGFSTDSGWYSWGSGNDQKKNGEWLRDVLKRADSAPWLERLAVYNAVESKRQITEGSSLTSGGKIWGDYLSKLAYDSNAGGINYMMPWTHHIPTSFEATMNQAKKTVTFTWTNQDTDMTDSCVIELKKGSSYIPVMTLHMSEDETRTATLDVSGYESGLYTFRLTNYDYDGRTRRAKETPSVSITSGAMAIGQLQYGQLQLVSTDPEEIEFEPQSKTPYVVMGMISNSNTTNGISNHLMGTYSNKFKFRFYPWKLNTAVTFSKAETVDYLILPADTVVQLPKGMKVVTGKISSVKKDEQQVTFSEPFPEGVTPVVVAQNQNSSTTAAPVVLRIYDVTNTGFKARLTRQEGVTGSFNGQPVMYYAATPGQESIGGGKLLTVGRDSQSPVGGSSRITVTFRDENSETVSLKNPYIIACAQTNNYEKMSVLRMHSKILTSSMITGASIRRQTDPTSTVTTSDVASNNGDYVGWFIVSDDPDGNTDDPAIIVPTGITTISKNAGFSVSVDGRSIVAEGRNLKAYTLDGSRVELGKPLPRGVYVVSNGRQSVKVQVK